MIKYGINRVLLLLVICTVVGCDKKSEDQVELYLENFFEMNALVGNADTDNVQKRVKIALQHWRNGELDSEPMLLYALLGNLRKDLPQMPLAMSVFDEDADLLGFGIREKYVGEKGQEKILIDERYPVYARLIRDEDDVNDVLTIVNALQVDVHIRSNNQRKDITKWDTYINASKFDYTAEVNDPLWAEKWVDSIPPIWVSMPVPGELEVLVYAIDRAGNESSPIPLVLHVKR